MWELVYGYVKKSTEPNKAGLHGIVENKLNVVRKMLKFGFDVNYVDDKGMTPLMHASKLGNEEACKLILQQKPDVEKKSKKGFNSIMLAAYYGKLPISQELVRAGAKLNELSGGKRPRYALDLSTEKDTKENAEVAKYLAEQGAIAADYDAIAKVLRRSFTDFSLMSICQRARNGNNQFCKSLNKAGVQDLDQLMDDALQEVQDLQNGKSHKSVQVLFEN